MSTVLIGGPAAPPSPQQTGGGDRPGAAGAFGDALGTALGDPTASGAAVIGGEGPATTDAGAQLAPADSAAPNTGLSALAALLARITGGSKQDAAIATTPAATTPAATTLTAVASTLPAGVTPGAASATPLTAVTAPATTAPATPPAAGGKPITAAIRAAHPPAAGAATASGGATPAVPAAPSSAASPAAPTPGAAAPSTGTVLTGPTAGTSTSTAIEPADSTTQFAAAVAPILPLAGGPAAPVAAGVVPAAGTQDGAALSGPGASRAPAGPVRPGRTGKSSPAADPADPSAAAAGTPPLAATPSAAVALIPIASPSATTPSPTAPTSTSAGSNAVTTATMSSASAAGAAAAPVLLASTAATVSPAAATAAPDAGTPAATLSAQPQPSLPQSVPPQSAQSPSAQLPAFGTAGAPVSGFAQAAAAAAATEPSASSSAAATAAPAVADAGSTAAQLTQLPAVTPLQQTAAPVQVNAQVSTTAQPTIVQQLQQPLLSLRSAPDGDHVVVVTVTPDHLGPVTVHATVSHGDLTVQLFAPTSDARDALKSMLSDLRRDLGSGTAGTATTLSLGSGDAPQQDARGQNPPGWAGAGGFGGSGQGGRWGASDDPRPWTPAAAGTADVTTFRTQNRGSGLLDVLA